jgi:hypothetical protein
MTSSNFTTIIEQLEETQEAYEGLELLIGLADIDYARQISTLLKINNKALIENIKALESLKNNKTIHLVK